MATSLVGGLIGAGLVAVAGLVCVAVVTLGLYTITHE
jgi:hypothetical protein